MVNKKCAREDQCTQDMIGCHESGIPGVKVSKHKYTLQFHLNLFLRGPIYYLVDPYAAGG